ncbi:MAG: VPLPA-CTERM sorting domain-containing protein [Nitrospira sp.]|nr:VPLPA-CTERM sorting domain-containing protein [Nitrospira sp.]
MKKKAALLGSFVAVALIATSGVASAHVGYGVSLYDQATNTWGPLGTTGVNPVVSSNAGWISGMSNNGVNRTATIDTLADSHNNRFRFFTLTSPSTVTITVVGTPNPYNPTLGITPSTLNPGFSIFSGQVPAASHDGVGDTNGLTAAQIATMQSSAMVGTAPNVANDGGYLQYQPAFATWSPFFDAMDEIIAEGGPVPDPTGPKWGVYRADGNVTMGNNNGLVSTMYFTGIAVGDGYGSDPLDNSVSWTGTLGPGTYSLVIGGTSLNDLQNLFALVQQGAGNPAQGYTACDYNNPVSCNGTSYPPEYAQLRARRNMFIRMSVNGELSPVPVPAAVYLFGAGLVGLAGLARRKNNA